MELVAREAWLEQPGRVEWAGWPELEARAGRAAAWRELEAWAVEGRRVPNRAIRVEIACSTSATLPIAVAKTRRIARASLGAFKPVRP